MRFRRDVRDWVMKAEEDYAVVYTLQRRRKSVFNDSVCFHAQQCAEKYLKALLVKHRIGFPKTHDVLELLRLAKPVASSLELLRPALEYLEPFAVDMRYPGEFATRTEAQRATRLVRDVRSAVQMLLEGV